MSSGTSDRGRVLVVDDDEAVRTSICALLSEEFDIKEAGNIADAERVLEQSDMDVVLTDYDMPGGTGMEFLRKTATKFPLVMGILVTGHAEHPDVQSAENNQVAVRVISKPYDPERLIKWVGNTVRLARMRRSVTQLGNRAQRRPMVLKVAYPPESQDTPDIVLNLAVGGLFLRTDRALQVGQRVELQLSFPGVIDAFAVQTEVRWASDGSKGPARGYGIAFRDISPEVNARIEKLIATWSVVPGQAPKPALKVLIVHRGMSLRDLFPGDLDAAQNSVTPRPDITLVGEEKACVSALQNQAFQALIVDEGAPGAAEPLIAQVRALSGYSRMPIVVLNNGPAKPPPEPKLFVTHLRKPIQLESLLRTLNTLTAAA